MTYLYLLLAGILVSVVHVYIVWRHKSHRKRSISEYAILDKGTYALYFATHIICDVLVVLYAYQFFIIEQNTVLPFYFLAVFAVLDFVQAALPFYNRTKKIHSIAAYVSWTCYLLAGLVSLLQLHIQVPYNFIAWAVFIPVLGMFVYMHINRSKLYPYQLLMVPLYVVCMLMITLGAS